MTLLLTGVLTGILATIVLDTWAGIVKHVLHLPTANWALVGRWFGHMAKGQFVHQRVADSAPVSRELALGWIGHYLIGVVYGIAYLLIVEVCLSSEPSLVSAVAFGLATLVAPWCIMQPAMGAGFFASRTPRPAITRLVNLSMHLVFGLSLYATWALIRAVAA